MTNFRGVDPADAARLTSRVDADAAFREASANHPRHEAHRSWTPVYTSSGVASWPEVMLREPSPTSPHRTRSRPPWRQRHLDRSEADAPHTRTPLIPTRTVSALRGSALSDRSTVVALSSSDHGQRRQRRRRTSRSRDATMNSTWLPGRCGANSRVRAAAPLRHDATDVIGQ